VFGRPDDRTGERACAVLRLCPAARAPSLRDVREHLAALGMARPKWPEEVPIVTDFPRTASGKVRKFVLREQTMTGRAERGEEER
jgi:acyl-CoA synthetase (AMP-forming)/AMP-acid ligase II